MAYEKHTWTDNEVITKEKLNKIEEGIANIELTPGPKGETGETGPKGERGEQGIAGTNGLGWLFGTNVPSSEGRDGDLYLKTDNFDVYKKVSGSWQKVGNIKGAQGPAGAAGAKGDRGETGPQGPKGADAVINKLNRVDALTVESASTQDIATAFNNLIADLKAKEYMNSN